MTLSSKFLLFAIPTLFTGSLFAQAAIPEIPYDSAPNLLTWPERIHLGEAVGVATNSKGNIFVYTRTGSVNGVIGGSRVFTRSGARLFEFDPKGKYIREIGQGLYGFQFAHVVRVDPQDNIWAVDEGSNVIIKFNPEGRVIMTLGRKPESINIPAREGNAAGGGAGAAGDNFNRPTDVAWDSAGNIFISDGYGNSRVAKLDKNGKFIKSWGTRGTATGQFNTPHSIATDAKGNVYVGDRGNRRLQVFDNDGNFKTAYTNVGAPWAVCITPGAHQYLYSSNSNGTANMENGEIYKMELDGTVLGKFGTAGKLLKEFGSVHEIDCRNPDVLYVGEITNWRVQKLTLKPSQAK
jgi:DNA-binding beta-propeller fold protein YncE